MFSESHTAGTRVLGLHLMKCVYRLWDTRQHREQQHSLDHESMRSTLPALVNMDCTPLDNLLLELWPRMLKQDLHGSIHIVPLHDLHKKGRCG